MSLLIGAVVGLIYALVGVRSPAPPLIALVGLLGIVLGEEGTAFVRHHLNTPAAKQGAPSAAPGDP
ncbi:DUF1427 family protein [Methylobacterium crusticola]|uniref:DUF1427 family protein n=1 Tax=Methylobacterium crusticola TaxID=1697972 RepID=UPI000FFBFF5F|nr:DUF1427 family protein [Methylobacterium crusticola]